MFENFTQTKVGDIVAENYLASMVFTRYGIDFCCGGQKTIEQVCKNKTIDIESLKQDLETCFNSTKANDNNSYITWELDDLVEHIINNYHHYIQQNTPIIKKYLDKLAKVHGKNHPELITINELFTISSTNLAAHLQKEETILFPYIKQLVLTFHSEQLLERPAFTKIELPIKVMKNDHEVEGEIFNQIRQLSKDYTPPIDACNTYKAAYAALSDFEKTLHLHIHLENNVLFPKAIQVEDMSIK